MIELLLSLLSKHPELFAVGAGVALFAYLQHRAKAKGREEGRVQGAAEVQKHVQEHVGRLTLRRVEDAKAKADAQLTRVATPEEMRAALERVDATSRGENP